MSEIKIGDRVIVDRGSLPHYTGILKSVFNQGWWQYGEIETDDGEIKMWDSDVNKLIKVT